MPSSESKTLEPEPVKTSEIQTELEASNPNSLIESQKLEARQPSSSDQAAGIFHNGDEREVDGEGEEVGECGFCLFMKEGGCKDSFIAWEKCVEEAEKKNEDIVEQCFEVTNLLKKCMEAHSDYYEPILRAEKAAEEAAVKELEQEADNKDSEDSQSKVRSIDSEDSQSKVSSNVSENNVAS